MPASGDLFLLTPDDGGSARTEPLAMPAFVALAAESDLVLLGETHTSPCDHQMQERLIRAMAASGLSPAIGLEMAGVDKQDVLDRFNAGQITPEGLREALDWDATWGHPFELYLPIFQAARELSLPLYALNVPPRVIRAYREQGPGNLDPADQMLLPQIVVGPSQDQIDALQEEMERHAAMVQERGTGGFSAERFFAIQSLWDSMMAEQALKVRGATGRIVAVIAGAGHVEYGWGIRHRVTELAPETKVLLVVPWRGGEADAGLGDVLAYCPLAHRSRLGFELSWDQDAGGVRVESVESGSKADSAGVQEGDLITAAMGQAVESLDSLHEAAMQAAMDDGVLRLTVRRGDQELELGVDMGPDPGQTGDSDQE